MVNANRYLKEVISEKKARSINRDVLIDAYTAALVENSYDSLMAKYWPLIQSGEMTQAQAEAQAEQLSVPNDIIADLKEYVEEFADIAIAAAHAKGLVIDSLETYFSNLGDIKNLRTS